MPLASVSHGIPWHVRVAPEDGGVLQESRAIVDQRWTVSRDRLTGEPPGRVTPAVMSAIEGRLRLLLGLN